MAITTGVWLTVEEAAGLAKVSEWTLYRACELGELRHVRIGGRRLECFVESQSACTAEDDPFIALLDALLADRPDLLGREMTTAELARELRNHQRYDDDAPDLPLRNAKVVGHHLRRCAATLTKHYGFEKRSGHAGKTYVRFRYRAGGEKPVRS